MSYPKLSELDVAFRKYLAFRRGWLVDWACRCSEPAELFVMVDGYYFRVCSNCRRGIDANHDQ